MGAHTTHIEKLLDDDESNEYLAFEESFSNSPDSALYYEDEPIFKQQGILAQLIHLNDPVRIKKDLGNYLIKHFKYMNPSKAIILEQILNPEDGSTGI
ncbi:MAG: hypothetical protein ACLUE2_15125 [Bacteroides cellulosilyticus]